MVTRRYEIERNADRMPAMRSHMFLNDAEKQDKRDKEKIPRGRVTFAPATTKITIASLDEPTLEVVAQYNPKELQLDRTIPWAEPTPSAGKKDEDDALEFSHSPARTLTVELTFDSYEKPHEAHRKVEMQLDKLEQLAIVRDASSRDEDRRRPHHCVVSWGLGLRPIRCVIEGLSIKILMFASDGVALRAVATVKLKEAQQVKRRDKSKGFEKPNPTR